MHERRSRRVPVGRAVWCTELRSAEYARYYNSADTNEEAARYAERLRRAGVTDVAVDVMVRPQLAPDSAVPVNDSDCTDGAISAVDGRPRDGGSCGLQAVAAGRSTVCAKLTQHTDELEEEGEEGGGKIFAAPKLLWELLAGGSLTALEVGL